MIFQRNDGTRFLVNAESFALKTIGFIALAASIQDGLPAIAVSLGIFILDILRNPYPTIMDIEEGDDNDNMDGPNDGGLV